LSYLAGFAAANAEPDPFTNPVNNIGTANSLQTLMGTSASGTALTNMMNGLQSYLTTTNPAPDVALSTQISPGTPAGYVPGTFNAGISVQNAIPTASYLANALNDDDGVELTIIWGVYSGGNFVATGGAHEVTLYSLNMTAGSGTVNFIDPWGTGTGGNAGTTGGVTVNATVSLLTSGVGSGYLYLTYPITLAGGGQDPQDDTSSTTAIGTGGETGIILDDAVESLKTPDSGSTALMLAAVAAGLACLCRLPRFAKRA
jgi:hypothetical protein